MLHGSVAAQHSCIFMGRSTCCKGNFSLRKKTNPIISGLYSNQDNAQSGSSV